MGTEKTHDLYNFMEQISDEMSAEYHRIQRRAAEDPGTAGDQGEENWAELLRGWIPPKPIPRWDVHFGILKTTEKTPRMG